MKEDNNLLIVPLKTIIQMKEGYLDIVPFKAIGIIILSNH